MKASLGKLRRFALNKKSDDKDKADILPTAQLEELAQASRDLQAMRDCYESLLSAAAATANSSYEFSESLGEMGSCLREKTALHGDRESGKLMSMLGVVQFELQDIFDSYRSHVFLTITNPSESLLNELRTVEDMKRQCDAKREAYDYMMAQLKGNRRQRSGKGQTFTLQELHTARDEFIDVATLCTFRLKSMKQGLSQTLLTQAARHYAAQLDFFRKGLESLEAMEQDVRVVADLQHIECHLSGVRHGTQNGDGGGEAESEAGTASFGELTFDYRANTPRIDAFSPANLMEVSSSKLSGMDHATGSNFHSAPLFLQKGNEMAERFSQMQRSTTRNSNTYVLPLPTSAKDPPLVSKPANLTRSPQHIWHSSPLENVKIGKDSGNNPFPKTNVFRAQSPTLKRNHNSNGLSTRLPLPRHDGSAASGNPNIKRQAFSGPLLRKCSPTKPREISPRVSPHRHSSPVITELHELPRPPGDNSPVNRAKSPVLVDHSAPLVSRNPDASTTRKYLSPLPSPPSVVPRSLSTPSRNQRGTAVLVSKRVESSKMPFKIQEVESPPLTPISFGNVKPVLNV